MKFPSLKEAKQSKLFRIAQGRVTYPGLNENLPHTPEEEVRARTYVYLKQTLNYPDALIAFERKVKMGSNYKFVDITIFKDAQKTKDFILIECKKAKVSPKVYGEAVKQAFSYDNQLPTTQYLWVTDGDRQRFYKTKSGKKGRERTEIKRLPAFGKQDALRYKLQEFGGMLALRGKHLGQEYLLPFFRKDFWPYLLFYLLLFSSLGLFLSWGIDKAITPFVLKRTKWMANGTLHHGHLYWLVPILSTFLATWELQRRLFPRMFLQSYKDKRGRKRYKPGTKRQNTFKFIAVCVVILAPSLLFTEWYFGYEDFCLKCCEWKHECWWGHKHYLRLNKEFRFQEYFWPFAWGMPLQIGALLGISALYRRVTPR